ncbi:MAG: spermidine/putrescine ABC transporter substrate-binding protein [Anaerolineales bacterium]|nr:spermidine/putrescine ABC transporter substrate-binding protein [Anaerolineales bacterium]
MRKSIILFIALALLVGLVPQLTNAQDDEMEDWTCPEGLAGKTLSIYNWSTYIAEDTVPNFEELCDVDVVYDVFESNEAMLARIREGNPGYDIVVPTDYMISIMIGEDLLEPLNHDLIPNLVNVSEQFLDSPFDSGNVYSVPYQWGTVGIGYNVNDVGAEVTSWEDLFEYDGPVAWLEDSRAMISFGLILQGFDPNSADPDEIAEARDYLIDNSSNVQVIAADDGQAILQRGDVDMTVEYSGDIFQIIDECGCDDFAYVIPEEGSVVWVDNLAIPVDAPEPELAHAFIDYVLDPQVGADISNYTAYASPNQAAIDMSLIDEDFLSDPAIYPTDEVMDRLYFIADNPDAELDYLDAWDEIVIFSGN